MCACKWYLVVRIAVYCNAPYDPSMNRCFCFWFFALFFSLLAQQQQPTITTAAAATATAERASKHSISFGIQQFSRRRTTSSILLARIHRKYVCAWLVCVCGFLCFYGESIHLDPWPKWLVGLYYIVFISIWLAVFSFPPIFTRMFAMLHAAIRCTLAYVSVRESLGINVARYV